MNIKLCLLFCIFALFQIILSLSPTIYSCDNNIGEFIIFGQNKDGALLIKNKQYNFQWNEDIPLINIIFDVGSKQLKIISLSENLIMIRENKYCTAVNIVSKLEHNVLYESKSLTIPYLFPLSNGSIIALFHQSNKYETYMQGLEQQIYATQYYNTENHHNDNTLDDYTLSRWQLFETKNATWYGLNIIKSTFISINMQTNNNQVKQKNRRNHQQNINPGAIKYEIDIIPKNDGLFLRSLLFSCSFTGCSGNSCIDWINLCSWESVPVDQNQISWISYHFSDHRT
jgi:hypothetical protein